ncbi:MAG: hypothetical protein JW755_07575 [Candidatus Aminicenantes bacterium]|nr:hypothetical protein [Candidatus Aminicenantes bacterium]
MFVYSGIDEAGYGPMFGPLVISRSTFILDQIEPNPLEPPSLWTLLRSAVCKKPNDKKKRLAVNDSKLLYNPAYSLKHLERGVLSFLSTSEIIANDLNDLLKKLAFDELSHRIKHDWYHSPRGEPKVPFVLSPSQLDPPMHKLHKTLLKSSIHLADVKAAVVFEDRFNQMVKSKGTKAGCAWNFVSGHIESIWSQFGEYHPLVVIDRQGGRKNYQDLLESKFAPAEVTTLHESSQKSFYKIAYGSRKMFIQVQVNSEKNHLPVALASMISKYIRELLMARFQNFWSFHAPEIKPTCGYFKDGRRFLKEIQSLIKELNIDPENFIRCR